MGPMMKYWHYDDMDKVMDKRYIDLMMLNATINPGDSKDTGSKGTSGGGMSFFDFGKKLSGIN